MTATPTAPPRAAIDPTYGFDPAFDRDRFLLRQKHLSLSHKYFVYDEAGRPILFVLRPGLNIRSILALLAAIVVFVGLTIGGLAAGEAVGAALGMRSDTPLAVGAIAGLALGVVGAIVAAILISPRRHVSFYRDESRGEPLLRVLQDQKVALLTATYTVLGQAGEPLARLRKNYLHDIVRKRWDCLDPEGRTVCIAREDSIVKAILRRFLGPMYGLLRTNFILVAPGADGPERPLGRFDRQFTLLDRYVLDLSADPEMALDRRVALALGVMLDTGERR